MTTKKTKATTLKPTLPFSYNQFLVYDDSVRLPGCDWTDDHMNQGFARRESTVNFQTLLESGEADVVVTLGAFEPRPQYERVVAVPFRVTSGKVVVDAPDEDSEVGRSIDLLPGNYRLVAAQNVVDDETEEIHLFFEALTQPLERSVILVRDDQLDPPSPLSETAAIAGEDD
jgi:hypothetical protein